MQLQNSLSQSNCYIFRSNINDKYYCYFTILYIVTKLKITKGYFVYSFKNKHSYYNDFALHRYPFCYDEKFLIKKNLIIIFFDDNPCTLILIHALLIFSDLTFKSSYEIVLQLVIDVTWSHVEIKMDSQQYTLKWD